jgi:Ca2+-binding RTX toxin-like protein
MSKTISNHSLLSGAHNPSSISGNADSEDELSGASGMNFGSATFDTPSALDRSIFENHNSFNSAGPNLVLYSSDVNISHGHAPEVMMAAGGPPGTSGGGTATTSGTDLVSSSGLSINITWDSSVSSAPTEFKNVVLQVANYFVNHFTDHITLNINVGYGESDGYSLGSALGMSVTYLQSSTYSQIQSALTKDATTSADSTSVASLLGDPTSGGNYWISTAEAKAMGLLASTTNTDGFVGFSNSSGIFDYNNTDGVTAGTYDFFGVVAHEFSEVMGRMLLVGGKIGTTSNSYDPLDLFHFSSTGVHDLSGTTAGYFSADNGTTNLHNFNVSPLGGDRGDWATSATADAFDAFGTSGVVEPISGSDLTALDVIGWNAGSTTPHPDLSVSNMALNVATSGNATLNFQINNIGTADITSSSFNTTVALYSDSALTHAVTPLATVSLSSLAAGASAPESIPLTLSAQTTAGTYYIGVITDSDGKITELSETNNTASVPVILGTNGNDTLTGTSGVNIIMGFDGNDVLTGGASSDTLVGGNGNDRFVYQAKTDGVDHVLDFTQGSDELDFSYAAFGRHLAVGGANTGTLDPSHFALNNASAQTAQFIYNTTSHVLSFDRDGMGANYAPIQMAVLENGSTFTLHNTDIHLI